jgi:tetratricopeptide (TPR) repeat protein
LSDIFLSYGHSDVVTARRFAEGLERAGFSVWWDATLHSGDSFDAAIEAALRGARAVVVLWSAASVQSRWVRAEATLADRLAAYLALGDLTSADAALERSLRLNPAYFWSLKSKAIVAAILGRKEEAVQLVCELRAIEPHITLAHHQSQTAVWMTDKNRAREANEILRVLWSETESVDHAKH